MRRLTRGPAPAYFDCAQNEANQRLRRWYQSESAAAHWNDSRDGVQPVREAVRAFARNRCAFCEAMLEGVLEVEHYLPKHAFPKLRFCWENFLPSCRACNRGKLAWHPPSLVEMKLVDPVLCEPDSGAVAYVPATILPSVADRIVEPTVDLPSEHLTFNPLMLAFDAHTPIGERTRDKLFSDLSRAKTFQKLFSLTQRWIVEATSTAIIDDTIALIGHDTIVRSMLAFHRTATQTACPE